MADQAEELQAQEPGPSSGAKRKSIASAMKEGLNLEDSPAKVRKTAPPDVVEQRPPEPRRSEQLTYGFKIIEGTPVSKAFEDAAKLLNVRNIIGVRFNTSTMCGFFGSMYDVYTAKTGSIASLIDIFITRNDFIRVCRYLTYSRVHHVQSAVTGRRWLRRIPVPREIPVPKAIADIINTIGVVYIHSLGLSIYPFTPDEPANPATSHDGTDLNTIARFRNYVTYLSRNYGVQESNVAMTSDGTAWWLGVFIGEDESHTFNYHRHENAPEVITPSTRYLGGYIDLFCEEFTPADIQYALIVQRTEWTGEIADLTDDSAMRSERFTDIGETMNAFAFKD